MDTMESITIDGRRRGARMLDPVHLTALHYLSEALREERYEAAPEILKVSREIGVREDLIRRVLAGTPLAPVRAA